MIILTDAAVAKIKEMAEAEELQPIIRAKILSGGCSGFRYDLELNDLITETDEVAEQDGVKVVVDQVSLQYMEDAVIDYVSSTMQSGFTFRNPTSTGSCGCGKSFSV